FAALCTFAERERFDAPASRPAPMNRADALAIPSHEGIGDTFAGREGDAARAQPPDRTVDRYQSIMDGHPPDAGRSPSENQVIAGTQRSRRAEIIVEVLTDWTHAASPAWGRWPLATGPFALFSNTALRGIQTVRGLEWCLPLARRQSIGKHPLPAGARMMRSVA